MTRPVYGQETLLAARELLYLSKREVQVICQELSPIELIREIFRLHKLGETILPDEAYLGWEENGNSLIRSLNMPAYIGGGFRAAGTKIINSNPMNTRRGLPRASGLTMVFDPETLRVLCIMEASHISALRTASVTVLCIKELAQNNFSSLTVIGAGAIGRAHIELAVATLPAMRHIILFDVDENVAEALATNLEFLRPGLDINVAPNVQEAVQNGDVVILATTVTTPYIQYEWLKSGATVVNVSLDDLMPEVFLRADMVFVDDWNLVRSDKKRLLGKMHRDKQILGPNEAGYDSRIRKVNGEIGDLVVGLHPGRTSTDQIIIVNPFGLAIEDVAFASQIYGIAKQRGIGTRLPV